MTEYIRHFIYDLTPSVACWCAWTCRDIRVVCLDKVLKTRHTTLGWYWGCIWSCCCTNWKINELITRSYVLRYHSAGEMVGEGDGRDGADDAGEMMGVHYLGLWFLSSSLVSFVYTSNPCQRPLRLVLYEESSFCGPFLASEDKVKKTVRLAILLRLNAFSGCR